MKELYISIKLIPKHFITAFRNIWRNGVMSFSSIFAVTITLLLVTSVATIALNINKMSSSIENEVNIYVKLDRNISNDEEKAVGDQIKQLTGIRSVTFHTKDEELTRLSKGWSDADHVFEQYRKDNPLGSAYEVEVVDAKDIKMVSTKIGSIVHVNEASYGGEATGKMINTMKTVRTIGFGVIIALSIIALLMIANTIKITITSRQSEIGIMRLVGASNWYIRLPFMLEGMLIGIIGSIIPILCLVFGYSFLYEATRGSFASINMLELLKPNPFIRNLSLIILGLGSGVGLIGSLVSVRRFLKL